MTKILKVVKPFFVMEEGDTFEKTEKDGKIVYVSSFSSEYNASGDGLDSSSVYNSFYEISENYAESLLKDGFLVEDFDQDTENFINVFDEIKKLYNEYADELTNLDKEMKDDPACLKVEKETVLRNMSKLLEHLYSLKK